MDYPSLTLYNLKSSERLLIYRVKKFFPFFIYDESHFLCNAMICARTYNNF